MVASTENNAKDGADGDKTGAKADEPKLEGAELLEAIKKQVEYYFSKENLMQDSFLVSKMDKEYYVDLTVLADFHLLKVLTTNQKLIIEAIQSSKKIALDDAQKKVRPVNMNARTTLILRNIPSSCPVAEVTAFLEKAHLPATIGLHPDVGDNWFASFESEDAAKKALEKARGLKWNGGKTIGCALKSENLLKGITPGMPPSTGASGAGSVPSFYVPMAYQYGYQYQQGEGEGGAMGGGGGGRGQGGRRGQGWQGGANGAEGEGQKKASKKSKGRGSRETGRDGAATENGASGGAAQQPPINLNEFPSLGAPGAKNGASPGGGSKTAAAVAASSTGEGEKKAEAAPEPKEKKGLENGTHLDNGNVKDKVEAAPAEVAAPDASSKPSASSPGASQPKKLSYAQMAQQQAQAASPGSPKAE